MKNVLIIFTAVGFVFSGDSTITYHVDGMMCGMNCPQKVNESLNGVDGIKSCKVDFEKKQPPLSMIMKKLIVIESPKLFPKVLIIK